MTEEILRNSSTCRCCMSQMSQFTDIFISHENFNPAEGLRDICGINIYPGDNLPYVICGKCFNILKSCYDFRIKTQQTDQTLHNVVAGNITLVKDVEDCVPAENIADESDDKDTFHIEDDSVAGFQCPCCSKRIVHKRNLQIHKRRHFMIGKYACPSCTQRFHTKFDLLRHSSTAHAEKKPYKCGECDKRFPTKPELNRHEKMHNPAKNFSCPECGMQFKLKANARQHIDLVHHKQKYHVCNICGKAFAFASKLKMHQKSSKCQRLAHQVFEVI